MADTPVDNATLNEGSFTPPHHVDVTNAEEQFNALARQLSIRSQEIRNIRSDLSEKTVGSDDDLEKAEPKGDATEPFDLREYLTSSNDANQVAGIKHKHVGVTWEDLKVDVIGGLNHKTKMPTRTILHESSGVLKPGEMCLVLGCPGSGCSTFLKTIANQRGEYANVSGNVLYAGITADEMAKAYKGEVVYNQEDDIHIATLTVAQTLAFALSTKTPGPNGRLPGVSRKEFDQEVSDTVLQMLNISHTKQTLVGDEFVRGVSGGERKRVSIAEMMATRARVQCWDNSTRGLDASTALDFVKSLRIMTDVLGQTTFVTLYQAGEGIYDLFDKVLVLDEGHQVFYGSPTEARSYFETLGYKSLPRQSTADYLTGCTDPNERQFSPGRSVRDVPSTPSALENAYLSSPHAHANEQSLNAFKLLMETEKADQEAFRAAVAADKKKGVSKKSPYTLGFTGQVRALALRQWQTRIQDRFQLYTSYSLSIALAFVIGAAYYNQPLTSAGAFTRGSVIFAALLTTCLDAFGEMPMQMLGRPILRKQTSYSMYRPSAIALANTLSDLPFSASRILIYNIIVYFLSGLHQSAGGFFTFHLFNYMAYLAMQGFFRSFGLICSNFDSAFRLAVFFIPNFRQHEAMVVLDSWQGCMENEFMRISITQILALEFYPLMRLDQQYGHNLSINIFAKETDETKQLNDALKEKKLKRTEASEKHSSLKYEEEVKQEKAAISSDQKTFTWENLNYHVPTPSGQKRLLHDVFGYVKPGTLTALMGASGAGKTTCLDVLAQRKNIGVVSGDILVDGRPLDSDFARGTAYAEQMDVHEGTATVREAMRFSAYLRQPASVSIEEKNAYVEEMIELLELHDLSEALVFSLNVEARKRLTIGVELASKPELLLFLDEPTSGLDAQSAWNLVRFLRKLADQGQAILCTIHQPSSLLFESFDRLLLLERGGETVYFGDIGEDSRIIRQYFARHGAVCPANVNPAEYMLEAIGAGVSPRVGERDWKDIWLDSPECNQAKAEIQSIKEKGLAKPLSDKSITSTYATSFVYQLKTVSQRNMLALWRSPDYIFTRIFVSGFIALFISLSFLQVGNSSRDLQFRVFAIRTFIRESSSRIYSPYVFAASQLIGEVPYSIICAIIYWALMVYPIGFGQGSAGVNGTGFQLLIVIFMLLFGVSLGQLVAALSPSVQVAVLFNPFLGLVLSQFCGVTIPYPTLMKFWRSWLYELDPYTRTVASMISTELHGLVIKCKSDEFAIFNPPAGQTCADWGKVFADKFGGYIDNLNDTIACRYCQYKLGDEFYEPLNISFSHRWRDAFILFSFVVFNLICTIIASRLLRYAKR
ncbi:hypothetical protein H0H93_013505 [Arthromyces matolae]|nr:hypothetical protein H0H93_013505 [Arthromyces matolae]